MKAKYLSKEWEKLIGKNLPTIAVNIGDPDWVLNLLGWKKDVRRN